jgi:pyruvate dehydrogenase E2 component (dihydrolipoamide acetyltransferase)
MSVQIFMPALSPTMEKGTIAKWIKKEGDLIKSGDILLEIETDKATMEVESIDEGTLAKILIPEGSSDINVGQLIAIIAQEGENPATIEVGAGATSLPPSMAAPALTQAATSRAASTDPVPAPAQYSPGAGNRVFASPLAKRLAQNAGIDLHTVRGSGPHGRIIERDVRAALAASQQASEPAPQPKAAEAPVPTKPASDDAILKLFADGSFESVPHDSMRKVIAKRLTESKQTVPHFYVSADCMLDSLLALREQLNASSPKDKDGKPLFKISVNDCVIKAMSLALIAVPDANVTWTDNAMLRHKYADVGVAVSIPGGLITPVVRRAETKTLSAISNEMKDYAARARARKLKPEEYQGGSTAVSNLGMFGVKNFAAIINPPHATILAVGAGEQRPIVEKGELRIASVMTVTLSTDHRAVDGALGAELLAAFKKYIENPMSMLA